MKVRYNASGASTRAAIDAQLRAQGRTWVAVARAAGVGESWLYMLPHARVPSLEAVQAVASVLEVTPWSLLWPEPVRAPRPEPHSGS